MLTWLHIRNLALVEELTLEFPSGGLVVLTGETGAGKSIVLGALNLLLGQRADRTLIRTGADSCLVEGVFEVSHMPPSFHQLLAERGVEPCEEGQLIIKRILTTTGTNRQFLNATPVPLALLQQVGDWLVDIHGPHDHQSLLRPAAQLALLDAFARLESLRAEVTTLYHKAAQLRQARQDLVGDERTIAQQIDLLRYQIQEIESAGFQPEEETTLLETYQRAANAAQLIELAQNALQLLDDQEGAILEQIRSLGRLLQELQHLDPHTEPLLDLHEQAISLLRELHSELLRYADQVELDPARLEELERRVHLLQQLKKKYGPTLQDVLRFAEQARQRLARLESREEELARLETELQQVEQELEAAAQRLSQARQEAAEPLARQIEQQLADLGFRQSRLEIRLRPAESIGPTGKDQIEFLFAPNPGEPLRPLRAIASSGEMARVMLAIKTVLAEVDQVPVLVFDEVDTNVGGETAHAVAEKMHRIARQRQVFCVTHLPVVAAAAHSHYRVYKEVKHGRTRTFVTPLTPSERVEELTRMLGGRSQEARRLAQTLLHQYPSSSKPKKRTKRQASQKSKEET